VDADKDQLVRGEEEVQQAINKTISTILVMSSFGEAIRCVPHINGKKQDDGFGEE
jgi:ribosomal protein L7Ae-like RNA K-turn-binding protein